MKVKDKTKTVAVSIIIPIYNVENYIRECLDSAINQTLNNIEIICVDDGSTDNSSNILDEYARKDSRIKIIHKANGGYGQAMNVGNSYAIGEYLAILEPDDYVALNMYEELYKRAKEDDLDFAKSDYQIFWGEKQKRKYEYICINGDKGMYNKVLNKTAIKRLFWNAMATTTGIYKHSFIMENEIKYNETPGASYQDVGFNFQVLINAKKAYIFEKAFYMYRQDNPNSSVNNRAKIKCIFEEQKFIYNIIKKDSDVFREYLRYYNLVSYLTDIYNFGRIADDLKHEFIQYVSEKYKGLADKKELDYSMLNNLEYDVMMKIMNNPKEYVEGYLKRKSKLLDNITGYKNIIIYGAGGKGMEVLGLLRGNLDKIGQIVFAVTNLTNNKNLINGYEIKCIEELISIKDNSVVVIGVSNVYANDIKDRLKELSFENVLEIF